MVGISKTFPGVKALDNVNFSITKGEIHALMGENGAGKSTLVKVLTGVHRRDSGENFFNGKPCYPKSPGNAQTLGISTIYQEENLVPFLSVAENIFLGRQPRKFGFIDWKRIYKRSEEILRTFDLAIDVKRPISSYSIAIQQLVSIARAVNIESKLIIMDEPTSSLDEHEVKKLFEVIRQLKTKGVGVLFITHFLDQVYEISDRITVLRNGRLVGVFETKLLPKIELIGHMLGKRPESVLEIKKEEERQVRGDPFIQVRGLGQRETIQPFDLDIKNGEVLGLAGLLGSGRTELARLLFGIDRASMGQITVDKQHVVIKSPAKAISLGLGFCPEDRKVDGIFPNLSVRENIILVVQKKLRKLGYLSRKKQVEIADKFIRLLGIVATGTEQRVRTLSGGNQQKVILARWLAAQPRFLILDEPTRGIDIGAKAEVEQIIDSLSREGMAILFISSELEEVVRQSHRVAVLRDRAKVAELEGDQIDEQVIMRTIAGRDA